MRVAIASPSGLSLSHASLFIKKYSFNHFRTAKLQNQIFISGISPSMTSRPSVAFLI
jgi:hypothetical protein